MRKFISLYILILASQFINACSTYHDQLQNKLADLSPEERRIVLAQECKDLILNGLHSDDQTIVKHAKKMQVICEEMTGQKIDIAVEK